MPVPGRSAGPVELTTGPVPPRRPSKNPFIQSFTMFPFVFENSGIQRHAGFLHLLATGISCTFPQTEN
jgi:hypothetical protein